MAMKKKYFLFFLITIFTSVNTYASSEKDVRQSSNSPRGNWKYSTEFIGIDKLKMLIATNRSINSLNLGFPYSGKNFGSLELRNSDKYGVELTLQIDKGQIICGLYVCEGRIKFDNSASIELRGDESSSGSRNFIFIRSSEELIKSIQNSKKIYIEIPLYRDGNKILEFNVDGLNMEKLKLK
jgi:hypothetical protein